MGQSRNKSSRTRKSFVTFVYERLGSVKFAVAIVIVIAVACIIGTILPQGADVTRYIARHPESTAHFGSLEKLGLTHVFSTGWFIGLIFGLAASVAVCSARRFATVRHTSGFARARAFGSMLTHISFLLILAGAVIRGVWGQKGFLEFREGETRAEFVTDNAIKPLPFAVHLSNFEIEHYEQAKPGLPNAQELKSGNALLVAWPAKKLKAWLPVELGVEQTFDAFKITVLKYVPDFVVDTDTKEVTSRSDEPRNPAVLVAVAGPTYSNHRWLFAKFPDFVMHAPDSQVAGLCPIQMTFQVHSGPDSQQMQDLPIKSFKSTLEFLDGGNVVKSRTIEVNNPATFMGYTFYQSGYNPNDVSYSSLQVVKDPGVPVVYTGFGLMIGGLFIVFYLSPWLKQQGRGS